MVFEDLRGFLKQCEKDGDMEKVEGADWNLEVGTISELAAEKFGPALLFDKFPGYPEGYRVATDLFTTKERIALAYGFDRDIAKPPEDEEALRDEGAQPCERDAIAEHQHAANHHAIRGPVHPQPGGVDRRHPFALAHGHRAVEGGALSGLRACSRPR